MNEAAKIAKAQDDSIKSKNAAVTRPEPKPVVNTQSHMSLQDQTEAGIINLDQKPHGNTLSTVIKMNTGNKTENAVNTVFNAIKNNVNDKYESNMPTHQSFEPNTRDDLPSIYPKNADLTKRQTQTHIENVERVNLPELEKDYTAEGRLDMGMAKSKEFFAKSHEAGYSRPPAYSRKIEGITPPPDRGEEPGRPDPPASMVMLEVHGKGPEREMRLPTPYVKARLTQKSVIAKVKAESIGKDMSWGDIYREMEAKEKFKRGIERVGPERVYFTPEGEEVRRTPQEVKIQEERIKLLNEPIEDVKRGKTYSNINSAPDIKATMAEKEELFESKIHEKGKLGSALSEIDNDVYIFKKEKAKREGRTYNPVEYAEELEAFEAGHPTVEQGLAARMFIEEEREKMQDDPLYQKDQLESQVKESFNEWSVAKSREKAIEDDRKREALKGMKLETSIGFDYNKGAEFGMRVSGKAGIGSLTTRQAKSTQIAANPITSQGVIRTGAVKPREGTDANFLNRPLPTLNTNLVESSIGTSKTGGPNLMGSSVRPNLMGSSVRPNLMGSARNMSASSGTGFGSVGAGSLRSPAEMQQLRMMAMQSQRPLIAGNGGFNQAYAKPEAPKRMMPTLTRPQGLMTGVLPRPPSVDGMKGHLNNKMPNMNPDVMSKDSGHIKTTKASSKKAGMGFFKSSGRGGGPGLF